MIRNPRSPALVRSRAPGRLKSAGGTRRRRGGSRIIDREGIAIQRRYVRWPGGAGGRGLGVDDPFDRSEHAPAHPLIEAAHVELDDGCVGDDVLLGAGLQRTDGDHGGRGGGEFPGNDGLQAHDRRRRHHHGIDARPRHRSIRPASEKPDLQAVARGGDDPDAPPDSSGRADHHVLAEHHIDAPDPPLIYPARCLKNPDDRRELALAHAFVESPHVQLDDSLAGDNVLLGVSREIAAAEAAVASQARKS